MSSWESVKYLQRAQLREVDFDAESSLDPEIRPSSSRLADIAQPSNVLLTGATGFLGSAVLHELVERTSCRIWCLVRCDDVPSGMQRLQEASLRQLCRELPAGDRVRIVPGDLARPSFGSSERDFEALGRRMDVIYHLGASVNALFPYSLLAAPNVGGTKEILRLAAAGRTSAVHYVSTAAILMTGRPPAGPIGEDEPLPAPPPHSFGYIHSKWIAEKALVQARQRGFPIAIYRPTLIGWHSRTGAINPSDFMGVFLDDCIATRTTPDLNPILDMVPLDHVARAIVELSARPSTLGKCFHLSSPKPTTWTTVLQAMRRLGFDIRQRPYREWLDGLELDRQRPMHRIGLALPDPNDGEHTSLMDLLLERNYPALSRDNFTRACGMDDQIPVLDERLLRVFVAKNYPRTR